MDKHVLTFAPTVERDGDGLPRRFAGVAYSGGVIPNYGPFGDTVIDLASLDIPNKALFALVDHDHTKRAGKFRAQVVDGQLRIEGDFFSSTPAGKEVAGLFAEGAPWELSVGIYGELDMAPSRIARDVNGQTLSAQTMFRNARLGEVSFVPVGADPATQAVAFAKPAGAAPVTLQEDQSMTDELQALQARVADLETLAATEKARADAAEARLGEMAAATRSAQLNALATDIGRTLTDEESGVLRNLDDAAYVVMAAALRGLKPAPVASAPAHLFAEQAVDGKAPTISDEERAAKARRAIFNQVSGRAA